MLLYVEGHHVSLKREVEGIELVRPYTPFQPLDAAGQLSR
jgi:hypothetical protein